MKVLIFKELRMLRPYIALITGFFFVSVCYNFATGFPDAPLDVTDHHDYNLDDCIFIFFFGLMMGSGLLINENEQRTLRFLDGLPVSRTRIFWTKVLAGFAVLSLVPLVEIFFSVFLSIFLILLDPHSIKSWDGFFPQPLALVELGLMQIVVLDVLAVAIALSFFRQWFALAVGLIVLGSVCLKASGMSWVELLNPLELFKGIAEENPIRLPWRHITIQVGVDLIALGCAWFGFCSLGDRSQHAVERISRHGLFSIARVLGYLLIPVVWIAAIGSLARMDDREKGPRKQDVSSKQPLSETAFGRTETKRFEFLFRESQREDAMKLASQADQVHDTVAGFLGATPSPSRIVVDLASPVVPHAGGQANWTKIRIPLRPKQSVDELRRILGHEATHVYIGQIGDNALERVFENTRFFHEGLATYVELTLFASPEEQQKMRYWAGAAWAIGKVPFPLLANNEQLSKARDPHLVYPLGEVFCCALVNTYGKDAPAKVIRAFHRPGAPTGLKDMNLWRDVMQACDFSFERVIAAYEAELNRITKEENAFVSRIPRLTASVETVDGQVIIRPHFEGQPIGRMVCMVATSVGITGNEMFFPDQDGAFRFPRSKNPSPMLHYMLGWENPKTRWPVFEPWVETAL